MSQALEAAPDVVWAAVGDMARYDQWVENTLRVLRTDGPAAPGATMEELTRVAGPWKTTTRWRVTEFEPPTRQVHVGEGVATVKDMSLLIELEPRGEGTQLTLSVRYTPRFGVLGALTGSSGVASPGPSNDRSRPSRHWWPGSIRVRSPRGAKRTRYRAPWAMARP